MSKTQCKLGALLMQDHYGEVVEKVCTCLVKNGAKPCRLLANETQLKLEQVKKAIAVLIQLGHVEFDCNKRGFVEYSARLDRILLHTRYPKYIYCAKSLYGDAGELIIEELLQNGHMLMSEVVAKVWQRLTEVLEQNKIIEEATVRQKFVDLVNTHFLQRSATTSDKDASKEDSVAPRLTVTEEDMYKIPTGMAPDSKVNIRKRKLSTEEDTNPSKKQKTEPAIDQGIYWCVNFDRFHQYMRDQEIVAAIRKRIDDNAASIVQTMLRISEVTTVCQADVTNPMSTSTILEALPKEPAIDQSILNQYLKILLEDQTEFISKFSTSGGGMYVVNIHKAVRALCVATLESTVLERFGQKSYRIFKLLLLKKYLEQKQIEEFALIPAKEAKEMLYNLFAEQLVTVQEIPRTPDHAPSRTFFLFNVNVEQVCRNILERSYKSLVNLILRRNHETQINKRVIEKSQRVEAIAASLQSAGADAAQTAEIEDMITPSEAVQLKRYKDNIAKLEKCEIQVDESIFILKLYTEYSNNH
ncbi:DNA-directed RNA polymerase III subunit RPC3-like [Anneissia japonica]|uniref:DNA-directed RNA polymerase III subunit RPC3-like n=1 Tax=Anneissia japonica TaxID=1529436 RepID=UPI001425671D|nr:DNA-directed RNA polymerase III subunit RPC3-like [Anneissia japonica]